MKNLFLLNRLGFNPDLTTRQSRVDSVSIASRYRVLATLLLCLTLFVGSGNVWAGVRSGWTRVTSVSEITSGGTFIVGFESTANSNTIVPMINKPSTLTAVDGSGTSYLYSGTASTSNNTTINMSDNGSGATTSYEFEFVTGSSSGTISIKLSDNTYVGFYGSSNNNCKRYSSVSTNSSFTPTITTNDVVTLTNVQYTGRKLRYNNSSGSYRFSNYSTAGNVVLYKKASSCDKSVGVTKGSESHGEVTTIGSASVATCSGTASDRRVTITVTPDDCYDAPSTLTWTKSSGTVSASKQSGPTDNGDGTYSYVYQFAQNDNGAGTFGVTCTPKSAGKTVNFNAGPGSCGTSSLTETCDGSGVTLPAVTATGVCKGWTTFAGWATAPVTDSTTTSGVTLYAAGDNFVPASNGQTLYAVYSKSKGGGGFKLSLVASGTTYYVGQKGSGNYLSAETSSANAAIFTYENGYLYYDDSGTKKYISITGNNTNLYVTTDKPAVTWTESGTTTFSYLTSAATRYLAYNGSASPVRFASYNNNSSYPQYFTKHSTATTYYCSDPNCCTQLASINGSISWSNAATAVVSWDNLDHVNSWTVKYKTHAAGAYTTWAGAQSTAAGRRSVTITGLTPCTDYDFQIIANPASGYCDKDQTIEDSQTHNWTVSSTISNVTASPAIPTTTCSGFSTTITPAGGYELPNTITVTNADYTWNSSTGALTVSNVTGNVAITITGTVAAYFSNGATVFVQAESSSAWDASACVKAWFNASGAGGSAQTTYWLFDATDGDAGKKLFATIVPATGDLNQVTLQRFASNCSEFWNNNGTLTKASDGGSNTFRSTGSGTSNVAWNGSGITLSLYGDPNSWASSLGTFADQGNGVWTATYNNYAPANAAGESQGFKISTNYNGWIGNTGNNDNATLSGMHVGSTYNITATLDVKDHSLTMSKTFVKGTVHFNLQGHGSAISDLTNVAAGSKISAPSAPSATGYDFGGWYKEPACTNAWNFASDVVNETMTLYAKWTKHTYTITSTLNNCSSSPAIPSSYEYTGSAASLSYTITPSSGYRLPTTISVSGVSYTWDSSTGALVLTGTITSNVIITITAVQTHTVTWKSNGENYVSPVVYDHGATLAFPAGTPSAPSSCSEKVFIGWTSDSEITSETSTEPTLITAGGAVNADAIYRAVFADEEGGGTKWVRVEVNSSFTLADVSEGQYALVDASGYAFNGTISSGHGQSTETAATFVGNEAASMPDGYCELTFTKVTDGGGNIIGYTMYSADQEKYLFAQAASTGNLAWHASETSYWKYYGSNWQYNSNSANLRVYNHTFRTYSNSSNQSLWLAKKTGGISYDNYITQCCALKPVTGLAVSSSTANSVTLSWTAPSPTTGIDHLELRNASTDAKIGSNIAVGTTSTSVSGLTECETYSYKIVSVGASCETSSDAIEAQPFSGAKTVTFDYNGGSGSPTSFTTSCAGNTVALPTPDTRTGYTFLGWWSAQFGGVKQGDAGDIYTVSGTTTLWAHWSETNYTVTMAQSPAAGAELTGGTTTAHYGGTINISTTVPSGYRFTGWTASPSVTFADASATSTSFTMPNSNVTVTANFVQVHTLTFVVPTGGGSAVTPPATADHGGTVTLPNVTGIAAEYSCETFLGWTTTAPNAEGGTKWSSTPTIKAAGATSDVINSNTTFYAVYSRSGGGASGTVELDAAAITAIGTAGGHAYADAEWSITAADLSSWAARAYVGNKGTYLQIKEDAAVYIKLPTVGGNYRSISLNHNSNSSSRTIVYRTTTGGSNVASCTTPAYGTSSTIDIASGTTGGYIMMTGSYTYQITSITASYGPAPIISHALHCDCPITQFDLTYNANTGRFPGSTISCDDVDDYAWAAHDDIYTICATEPTCEGYKFIDWTTNANGSGDHYNAGQEISCVSTADVTLYAQYERVYTVTFDNQGVTTPVTQASYGATIAVPSATTPCDAEWAFVGWSETAIAPMSFMPTLEITAGTSTYTPTADKTLYAIYRKTSESSPFVAGMSGAYKISNGSTVYAGACNNSKLPETDAAGAAVFYIKYTAADGGKYTIQQADGKYLKYAGESTSLALDDETPYYWTMTKNGDLWHVLGVGSGRYLQHSSETGFKAYNGSGYTDIAFVAAEGQYYYRTMSCADEFDITFHDNGTTINWAEGHPEATYKDLADATVVSTFPTATFDGWTFLGWRTADYDESTTAPAASGIYSTGGNALTISSADVDLYPVFTRFEDNPPFDEINGGDYYIYFLDEGSDDGYGAARRVYASSYADHKRYNSTAICASATEFTFTKLENGNWTIYDKTTSKYLYAEGDDWLQQKAGTANAEWTLTVNGNAFDAYCVGTSYGQISAYGNGLSATFENYARSNIGVNPSYHRVYLGGCTNRTFTTNPSTTPYITMNGEVAPITSSQNGAVRATNVLSVSGGNFTPSTGEITISSNNSDVYFSLSADKNFAKGVSDQPKLSVTITANGSGIVTPTPIYVHYKPSSNTDTWTSATITASYPGAVDQTATVELRTVKENFVIASKVGDNWYALPANMTTGSVYEPVLIDVDESAKIAYGPATIGYKMWPVQTVNGGTDEYATNGDKVRFAGNGAAGLWASNSNNNIRDWSTITAIGSTTTPPAAYEWIIETEDRNAYTLKSMYSTNYLDLYRPSSGTYAGKLVWASNNTYETNEIHFFPLEERAMITIIPREWKANGLVFSVAADNQITAASYKIGTGSETSTTYTRHSTGGYGLYEVALPDLTSQYGKLLTLKLTISGTPTYATTTIPIIVNANASTKTNEPFATLGAATKDYDVVVLDGKTLTTDAVASGACKFQNLYIYPGATLVNAANNNLSVRYLELRGGIKGIDHKSDLAQGVPHLKLDKNFSSTAGVNLDMCVNTAHSYALSVPFDVTLSTVNFANSLNTETSEPINGTLDAQFMIMEYDGAQRASTGKGWKHITSTERVLHAGEGYVLQGKRPKGQPFAVIRFPFSSVSGWADGSGEVVKSAVSISEHAGGASTPDNDKGWNLIANPYMATLSYNGADEGWAADFTVGSLVKTDTDPWDGKYDWESTTNAYVTMPNEWYTEFPQYRANSAQAVFEPFKNFFIQASANGSVTFDKSKRASAPRHLLAQATKAQPIYADINLTHGEAFAQAGLTVDENATAGYKFGEDQNIFENREALTYLKVYTVADGHYLVGNTMTPAETEELIPVEFYAPNAGEYIFSLDDNSDIDRLEYVILYDAVLGLNTNLLTNDYMVDLEETGLIENRFSIGLRIKEKDNSATGIGDVSGDPERPYKFIYRDKMYILRGGKIYDATGKQVREINK